MLSALNDQDETVMAWEVTREEGPFFCPACEEDVILKKRSIVIHHFAHYPEASCSYGTGESEQHRQAKYEIYEALKVHPSVTYLKVERYLKEVRPDVSFLWQGKWKVAIEMQISAISPNEIEHRTRCYAAKNIWVLWTTPYHNNISGFTPYNTRVWERYLHTPRCGRRFSKGAILFPWKPVLSFGGMTCKERSMTRDDRDCNIFACTAHRDALLLGNV